MIKADDSAKYTDDKHFRYGVEILGNGYVPWIEERYYDDYNGEFNYCEYIDHVSHGHLSVFDTEESAWKEAECILDYAIRHPVEE